MLVLSNSIDQTILPGQAVIFDVVVLHTGCSECYRKNSAMARLAAKGGTYEVSFGGNIGATEVGEAQLAIQYDGAPLTETTMVSQTAAAGDLNNVFNSTYVRTGMCEGGVITVANTGTTSVNVRAQGHLQIKRVS